MMGTLSAYTLLFMHQLRTCRCHGTWALGLYLVSSVVGRFGVAFLGFAFNIEEAPLYTAPLFRPNWKQGLVKGDGSHDTALAALSGDHFQSECQ